MTCDSENLKRIEESRLVHLRLDRDMHRAREVGENAVAQRPPMFFHWDE